MDENEELIEKYLAAAGQEDEEEFSKLLESIIEKGISIDVRDKEGNSKKKKLFYIKFYFI